MSVTIDSEDGRIEANQNLRKSGNSTVVTLPPAVLQAAGVEQGTEMKVTARMDSEGRIVLSEATQ